MGNLHSVREEVEALGKTSGNKKVVLIRPTFLMDESFYPTGHNHTNTKAWLVLVIDEKDNKLPDPRTEDGRDKSKVKKSRDDFKKASKTHYWFDDFRDAETKYYELVGSVCGIPPQNNGKSREEKR